MTDFNNNKELARPASTPLPQSVLALAEKFASTVNTVNESKDQEIIEEVEDYTKAFEKLEQADNNEDTSVKKSELVKDMLAQSVQSHVATADTESRSDAIVPEEGPREKYITDSSKRFDIETLSGTREVPRTELQELSPPPLPRARGESMDDEEGQAEEDAKDIAPLPTVTRVSSRHKGAFSGGRKPPSSSSSSSLSAKGRTSALSTLNDSRKSTSSFGYTRLVQNRSKWGSFDNQDASVKKSTFSLFKDRVGSLVRGEKTEERETRLRLEWYRKALEREIELLDSIKKEVKDHRSRLIVKFEEQKAMLTRNGMAQIVRDFEMQAWARVSRTAIVLGMIDQALDAFCARHKRSYKVIELFVNEVKSKDGGKGARRSRGAMRMRMRQVVIVIRPRKCMVWSHIVSFVSSLTWCWPKKTNSFR